MRRITAGLAIGLAAGVLALVIAHRPLFVTGESKLYDWRMRVAAKSGQPRGDIALVEINETSLRDLEPFVGRWQWPRITHAAIIGFIAAGRPKAIAYDVLFLEADTRLSFQYGEHVISGDESDGALGRAIQRAGNVVLLADASYEGVTGTAAQAPRPLVDAGYPFDAAAEAREIVTPPLDAYAAAAARAIGHNRLVLDSDGVARRIAPLVRAGDVMLPALGVAAAVEGAGLDKSSIRADRPLQIRFEGPPLDADGRRPYPSYEARHILLAADLGPGDCFGEMSLVTGEPRAASVAARGDCLAIEIPADAFAELARVN
ncbi:MAG TPA: CHASE2 domain-containing protein, partial [Vicinamibacterales bacterium]|nr:CHASE2 domain-containing protein [Vicinamibacterales bacterium]